MRCLPSVRVESHDEIVGVALVEQTFSSNTSTAPPPALFDRVLRNS